MSGIYDDENNVETVPEVQKSGQVFKRFETGCYGFFTRSLTVILHCSAKHGLGGEVVVCGLYSLFSEGQGDGVRVVISMSMRPISAILRILSAVCALRMMSR